MIAPEDTATRDDLLEETTSPPRWRFFQVSARGNGVGLTILRRDPYSARDREPDGPHDEGAPEGTPEFLLIHILPKLWGARDRRVFRLPPVGTLPLDGRSNVLQVVIHEQETVALETEWAECLAGVAGNLLVGPGDDWEAGESEDGDVDAERGAKDPLWSEVPPTRKILRDFHGSDHRLGRLEERSDELKAVSLLWDLLSRHGMEDESVKNSKELPPTGVGLLPDIPGLDSLIHRLFLETTEEALKHRRPHFLPVVEELSFVRGRMDPQGLIRRAAYHRLPVLCEFDSLSADSFLWQTIRGAAQIVAGDANPHVRERAIRCDAQLRDVSWESLHVLLGASLPAADLARLPEGTRYAYRYARSILSRKYGMDVEDSPDVAGVLTNLKFVTSGLWEAMLADRLRGAIARDQQGAGTQQDPGKPIDPDDHDVRTQFKLGVFFQKEEVNGKAVYSSPENFMKRPDVVLMNPNRPEFPALVLDAKYKRAPKNFWEAGMGDQYQLATYAYRLGTDAWLVYPSVDEDGPVTEVGYHLGTRDTPPHGTRLDTELSSWCVGMLALPFPRPPRKTSGENGAGADAGWTIEAARQRAIDLLRKGPLRKPPVSE